MPAFPRSAYLYGVAGFFSATTAFGGSLDLPGPEPTSLEAFIAISRPEPTLKLSYGPAQAQGIDVFLPSGEGPFPVAILIHGGCWQDLPGAGREQLRHIGADLAGRGIAVWSVGYRRADEPGGGYPGTFQDVSDAINRLRSDASRRNLDMAHTVLVGHSAGGHLALWAASRRLLPDDSPLAHPDPFVPGAVVSLAGIGDLRKFGPLVPVTCGPDILERLTGAALPHAHDTYAEISPAEMPAPDVPVLMVSGVLDRLVPPYVADDYARAILAKTKASVEIIDVPGAGHFDLVTPGTGAWIAVRQAIERALHIAPAVKGD